MNNFEHISIILKRLIKVRGLSIIAFFMSCGGQIAFAGDVPIPYDTPSVSGYNAQCFSVPVTDTGTNLSVYGLGAYSLVDSSFIADIGPLYSGDFTTLTGDSTFAADYGSIAVASSSLDHFDGSKDYTGDVYRWYISGLVRNIFYDDFSLYQTTGSIDNVYRDDVQATNIYGTTPTSVPYGGVSNDKLIFCFSSNNSVFSSSGAFGEIEFDSNGMYHPFVDINTVISQVQMTYEGCHEFTDSNVYVGPVSGNCGATVGGGTILPGDTDGDGIDSDTDPDDLDPCNPDDQSAACLAQGLILDTTLDLNAFVDNLQPNFIVLDGDGATDIVLTGETIPAETSLGYSLNITDPNYYISNAVIQYKSSCYDENSINSYSLLDFTDESFINNISIRQIRNIPENGFTLTNYWDLGNFDDSVSSCAEDFYIQFALADGRNFTYDPQFQIIVSPLVQERLGIFNYNLDFTLPPGTPGFINTAFKGVKIPFTNLKIGAEPFINWVVGFIGETFSWIFSNVPVLQDFESLLAPPPGEPLVYPDSLFGRSADFKSFSTDTTVQYNKQDPSFYEVGGIVVKFAVFFMFLMLFLGMFFDGGSVKSNSNNNDD